MHPSQWTTRVLSLLLTATGIFVALCLVTYRASTSPFLTSSPNSPSAGLCGTFGAWIGFFLRGGFGWASFVLPLLCFLWARRMWQQRAGESRWVSMGLAGLCLLSSGGVLLSFSGANDVMRAARGGLVGFVLYESGRYYLGTAGTLLTALCTALLAWVVVAGQPILTGQGRGSRLLRQLGAALAGIGHRRPALEAGPAAATRVEPRISARAPTEVRAPGKADVKVETITGSSASSSIADPRPKPRMAQGPQAGGSLQLPPLDLLATPPPIAERQIIDDLHVNARILEETLREFGIEARVVNIDRGPTVTRYELTPAPGVKLTRIVSLADDLALVMKAASCHIVAPIPGRGTVGVDIPNSTARVVYLKELLTSREFTEMPSLLALPIGKDVSGQTVVADLRECPHLLIAGATGSGKTVCLNSLLVGMLTRVGPDRVKFLMVDPKMVELALFNDLPHLIAPVVTSSKKASIALQWAVQEMERRYQLLARVGARNIELFNAAAEKGGVAERPPATVETSHGSSEETPEPLRPLPYLVIVIDELADLMMVASNDVENAITRLAQLSRAVGIHIILATQRPSVDVITGVIKANFPARIAFQVASKVDSRTILDMNGADKLLGRGDLLFLRPGTAKPLRTQGAFVTDAEIERITGFIKRQRPPSYDERFLERQQQPEHAALTEKDELYDTARQLVLETGQASTSLLQRRLRLGYGRAARMLDLMEQEGLVGPPQGSRPREILISREVGRSSP